MNEPVSSGSLIDESESEWDWLKSLESEAKINTQHLWNDSVVTPEKGSIVEDS